MKLRHAWKAATVALLVVGLAVVGLFWNYFRKHHRRTVVSPGGVARVEFYMQKVPDQAEEYDVTARVVFGPHSVEVLISRPDLWQDVTDTSYPVRWVSDSELLIGDIWGDLGYPLRVRLHMNVITVENIPQ